MEETENPLDVAIDGSAFLAVQTPGGERYTRDGNLQINTQGQLVTAAGNPVLGTGGPIVFQQTDHDINITPDGTITVVEGNGRTDSIRGTLRLVIFTDAQKVLKEGFNLYAAGEGGAPQADTKSTVQQGFIEKSNVNSVVEMSRMMEVSRAYTSICNADAAAEPSCRKTPSSSLLTYRPKETTHASASHCCDRDGGPGT